MESLMKKDLVEVINRQRSGTLDEYIAEPNVITEDIEDKVFDIVDGKGTTATIKRNVGEGTATYFNGDEQHVYKLRFIRYEEYLNHKEYLQPIITQYFIDNKSEIWLLFLIAHSKR